MENLILKIEKTLAAIKHSELKKNPRASAKALEIRRMIAELKLYVNVKTQDSTNQGVLKYINPKVLLEN